jgi:hypothetical protein
MQTLSNWQSKANEGKLKGYEQYDPQLSTGVGCQFRKNEMSSIS